MPLIADTGALFSVDIINQCIAPACGTMGFAVPAALGVQIASGRGRWSRGRGAFR
jgi:thiamine pyrophosphate-dependent acetolactate synthase large subunit-like protein